MVELDQRHAPLQRQGEEVVISWDDGHVQTRFTLIELLVVIAIIAIRQRSSSGLRRARREQDRRAAEQHEDRLAGLMYAQDYGGGIRNNVRRRRRTKGVC